MRTGTLAAAAIAIAFAAACDLGKVTVNTTSKVLKRAQPALQMESDYELAARAVPGTLKTVEGFYNVNPNSTLRGILTEGYCQYGTAFVEDEWELAKFAKDLDRIAELDARATKMFVRCLNYALLTLGKKWQEGLFGSTESVQALISTAGPGQRDALMWAALALGSIVNHNLNDIQVIAHLPTVKMMLARVLELDKKTKRPPNCSKDNASRCVYLALPHVAMGMLLTGTSKDFGGDIKTATAHFNTAQTLTGNRFLLPKVLYGYRVGLMTQDKALFRKVMLEVLATPPSNWPEQRLANEVAHRRARRYLKLEKELF